MRYNQSRLSTSATSLMLLCGFLLTGISNLAAGASTNADQRKEDLLAVCAKENYQFTPSVKQAFLTYAKAQAWADLQAMGQSLPDDFWAWVDADPQIQAGVYGTRLKPANILLMLYSLKLDLGAEKFEKYRHLALATALVHAHEGPDADINPRRPITLRIGGDPRKPVNTKDPRRKPDINDHIINFLNDNTITEEVVVGHKEVEPELKYDDRGIAIPAPKKKEKVAITEKRTRSLKAADVLASRDLQIKFNDYMKSKGHDVNIDCGDKIVHWKSRDMVRGDQRKKINEAYTLFKTAYEAKGLLPAERDPFPTPGEKCAYLIRNDNYRFPADLQEKRNWPRFPLTAPWPFLTMLAADNQPLREREERWLAFRDEGIFKTYGEYIGSVAQQFDMQSARRIGPYAFTYGSIQMMLKDGGVCGTMGNISARSHNTLGIPACTAGQPGHCAMVAYRFNPKDDTYQCKGGQYATGGDDKTTPHARWLLQGDFDPEDGRKKHQRKPMVYHQSIAWAVNYGMDAYMDSLMADSIVQLMDETERAEHGLTLLQSGLSLNPYNFLLTDAAQQLAATPQQQIDFWEFYAKAMAAVGDKPGCPASGLYNTTVKNTFFRKIGELPAPDDKDTATKILAVLKSQQCDVPAALVKYRVIAEGLRPLMAATVRDYDAHLRTIRSRASRENDTDSAYMAATIQEVANCIEDKHQRKEWAQFVWKRGSKTSKYFGHKYRVSTDASLKVLAKLAGQKMPSEEELMKPLLRQLAMELKRSLSGKRNTKDCQQLAAKIKAAGSSLKDGEEKKKWLTLMSRMMEGKETFYLKGRKAQQDPCADAIKQLLESKESA